MRRQGSGFGFVILLVAMAVLFFIAMNNFKSVAPSALEIKKHNEQRAAQGTDPQPTPQSTSASADTWNPTPPARPDLSAMDQKTTQHANDVSDALSQGN